MKAAISWILGLVGVILLVLIYRAGTYFENKQYQVSTPLSPMEIDVEGAVARFAGAIQLPTISHEDPTLFDGAAFEAFHAHLEHAFPRIHTIAERRVFNDYSLLFEIKGSDPTLKPALFMGHIDVVPVDDATLEQWEHGPFSGDVASGAIWGRGAIDDKVTVLALMEAMESLLSQNIPVTRTVYFAFGHDEEIGGLNGAAVIAEHFRKLNTEFEFVLDEGGAVTEGLMAGIAEPVAIIGIAEKGYVNLKLTVNADGGHSSQPPANTAAGILSQAIVRIEAAPFDAKLDYLNMTFDKIGYFAPFTTRLAMANQWLLAPVVKDMLLAVPSSAAGLRTTTAATMLKGSSKSNILPTRAEGVVNFRILPGDTIDSVIKHVTRAVDDERVEITAYMGNEASPLSDMDSMGYKLIEETIRRLDNSVLVAPYLVQGGTDAKHFFGLSNSVYRFMMVRLTPETLPRFHGVNEQIPIDDYIKAIQFYSALLQETVKG